MLGILNVTQADAMARVDHVLNEGTTYGQADDWYICAPRREIIDGIATATREFAILGLSLSKKNQIFSYTPFDPVFDAEIIAGCIEYGLEIVTPDHGLKVSGAGVGSFEFMMDVCNQKVDKIEEHLATLRRILECTEECNKAQVQTIYLMVRLCITSQMNHLLRTTPPIVVEASAIKLDAMIYEFVMTLTNSGKHLDMLNDASKMLTERRLFLSIREGGNGMTSAVATKEGAYLGSMSLCANYMAKIIKNFDSLQYVQGTSVGNALVEGFRSIGDLKYVRMGTINEMSIWDNQSTSIQRLINHGRSREEGEYLLSQLPQGGARSGAEIDDSLSVEDKSIRCQGIANRDSCAAAWLLANPSLMFNRMNNAAFCRAFHIRNLFPVMGSRKWCICGEKIDSLGAHMYICKLQAKRNEIRNPDHSRLTAVLRRICQTHSSHLSLTVGLGEPHCKDYFYPSMLEGAHEEKQSTVASVESIYVERRADIGMLDVTMERQSILIDCTMVATNAAYIIDYANPGQAGEQATRRKVEYYNKHFDIADTSRASLVIFAVETTGGLSDEARKFCKFLGSLSGNELSYQTQWIYQQIAVRVQTSRAQNIDLWRLKYSLDDRPNIDLSNRESVAHHPPAQ